MSNKQSDPQITEIGLEWPVIDLATGALAAPPSVATAAFVRAWIVASVKLELTNPSVAGQFREALGGCANKPIFNADAVLVDCS